MRFSIGARIALTLLANLFLLAALFTALFWQQSRGGLQSLLLSPSQDRIRGIASAVAEELPGASPAARAELFARYERQYGVRMLLYDRTGEIVHGSQQRTPAAVLREIRRQPQRPFEVRDEERRGAIHPVFLVTDRETGLYWVGVHIPLQTGDGRPMRHALVFVTPTILGSRLFFDWRPWLWGLLAAVAVSVLCWLPAVRGFLGAIQGMRQAAAQIAEGHFEAEVPAGRNDELGDLARSIAKMSEKLSRLVHGQRRFLADVAHELCAPLSRIQLSAGILEQRVRGEDSEYVRSLERDVRHMSNLVGDLLSFSKGAAFKPTFTEVPLAQLVSEIIAHECPAHVKVETRIDPALRIHADAEYLRRAFANVIRNAVTYAGEAGPIHVQADALERTVRLRVSDEGPGLPESEIEAVFEPFYRPDQSRNRDTGGVGLGLAIVKGCVEACGGTVQCRNRRPRGLEVEIDLPAVKQFQQATDNGDAAEGSPGLV